MNNMYHTEHQISLGKKLKYLKYLQSIVHKVKSDVPKVTKQAEA